MGCVPTGYGSLTVCPLVTVIVEGWEEAYLAVTVMFISAAFGVGVGAGVRAGAD